MKYLAAICVALLASVLICQMRILARLDEIATRPLVVSGHSAAPSAASIASEVRKQLAREARLSGPATFRIESKAAGEAYNGAGETLDLTSGRLQRATLVIVRDGGPAAGVAITSPSGITSDIRKIKSTEDFEQFEASFKPESGNFLPNAWSFTITYTGSDQKPHDRGFDVAYHPGKKHPEYLDVTKKDE